MSAQHPKRSAGGNNLGHTGVAASADIDSRKEPFQRWVGSRTFGGTILVVSAFLLLSMGGAILFAPLTVLALSLIARTRTGWQRVVAVLLAALTIAEVAWAFTYLFGGEAMPWIWFVPMICGIATLVFVSTRTRLGD